MDRSNSFLKRQFPENVKQTFKNHQKSTKCSKCFENLLEPAKRFRSLPSASGRIQLGPNRSEWIRTRPKTSKKRIQTCENLEKFRIEESIRTIVTYIQDRRGEGGNNHQPRVTPTLTKNKHFLLFMKPSTPLPTAKRKVLN